MLQGYLKHFDNLKHIPRVINGVVVFTGVECSYIDEEASLDMPAEKLEMMEFLNEGMTTSEKICDMGDLYLAVGDVVKAEEHYLLAHYMVPCRVIPLGKLIALYEKVGDEEKLFDVAQKIIDTDYSVVSSVTLRIRARAKEIISKFV